MTRNPIGLLEMALEIAASEANGCTSGACSCGEGEDCLASGWENALAEGKPMIIGGRGDGDEAEAVLNALAEGKPMFVPPLKPQPKQPAQSKQRIL